MSKFKKFLRTKGRENLPEFYHLEILKGNILESVLTVYNILLWKDKFCFVLYCMWYLAMSLIKLTLSWKNTKLWAQNLPWKEWSKAWALDLLIKIINKQCIIGKEFYLRQTEDKSLEDNLSDNSEELLQRSMVFSTVLYLVRTKNIKQETSQRYIPSRF